jgi:hypothetical protein
MEMNKYSITVLNAGKSFDYTVDAQTFMMKEGMIHFINYLDHMKNAYDTVALFPTVLSIVHTVKKTV